MYVCILYIYIYIYTYHTGRLGPPDISGPNKHSTRHRLTLWPLQDIRSHQSCLALLNHLGIVPPTCNAHMICNMSARRLRTKRLSLGFPFV